MHGRAVYCYNSATQIIYKFLELSCNDHLYHNKLFVFFIVYVLNLEAKFTHESTASFSHDDADFVTFVRI